MKKTTLFILSSFITMSLSAQTYCGTSRYDTEMFPNVTVTSDVTYGQNLDLNGNMKVLKMDIYQPTGDVDPKRPLIVFAHGGSFIGGSKTLADQVALCTRFAKRGYVAATIDYRLGMGFPINQTSATRAVWRAMQDMKAAVRFFNKDAKTTNTYRTDSNFVFIGGYSAGAFIAIHYAYLDQPSEIPSAIDTNVIGGFEGASGNPGYSTKIKGVLNFAGAIGDSVWINTGDVPMVTAQGDNDGTVPYCTALLSVSGFPVLPVSGGGTMHIRCFNIGMYNPIHTFYGLDHCATVGSSPCNPANIDTTIKLASDFVYKYLGCTPSGNPSININNQTCVAGVTGTGDVFSNHGQVILFPNPAGENLLLTLKEMKGEKFSAEIVDITGRKIDQFYFSGNEYRIERKNIPAGIYSLKITSDKNELFTTKIIFN